MRNPHWDPRQYAGSPPEQLRKQWAMLREREQERQAKRAKELAELWGDIAVGDTVILSTEMTKAEYGVCLTNDDGDPIKIDGVIQAINGNSATVKIMRVTGLLTNGKVMAGYTKTVLREHIERKHDGPPSYWQTALTAGNVQAKRDGRKVVHKPSEYVKHWEPSDYGA